MGDVRARVLLLALAIGRTASAAGASAPAAAGGVPANEGEPVEVTVPGLPLAGTLGAQDAPAKSLRNVPGTFGEPFQTIASQPGVLPIASGLPYFYVRGAPPADTGYFLDGVPLPTLFHIGPGPSVVPPGLLSNVDFFPGTAPARFGRFAGGIVSGELAPPGAVARGEASVRLFDASALVETPLDPASTILVAGRYGYPNWLLSQFASNVSLSYGDYTVRVTRKLSDADAVSILALGSFDQEEGIVPVDTLFHRFDARYDHALPEGSVRVAATVGYDRTRAPLIAGNLETVAETSARLRVELATRLGKTIRFRSGADVNAAFDASDSAPTLPRQVAGAYVDIDAHPTDRVEVVGGGRVDAYRSSGAVKPSFDPSLAVRIRVAGGLTAVTALSLAHQPPTSLLPTPGLALDPTTSGLQTVYRYAEGVELRLPWALLAKVTGFFSADRNMNDFASDCGAFSTSCGLVASADGSSYGLEVYLQRAVSQRLSGWISYTLSRAERHIGTATFLSPFDRTHVLSAVLRYDFGGGIEAGVRMTYDTGRPDIPSFAQEGAAVPTLFETAMTPQRRLPDFYRLDVRGEKRWSFDGKWSMALIVEFFDATLNSEAVDFECSVVRNVCITQKVGPVALPSIGMEAQF